MLVQFNTKNSNVDGNTLSIMESKAARRFSRYFANEAEDATTLSIKISDKKFRFKVELTLPYYGFILRTETYDDVSPVAALDKSMDAMESRMSKSKTKIQKNKHRTIEIAPPPIPASKEEPDIYSVVRIKSYEMKPMSVQDAILNMNMLGHTSFMFKNEETDKISTVYRRAEDDYGMIEPL